MKTLVLNTGSMNHSVDLDDGTVLPVGQSAKADISKPHNVALLESGMIVEVRTEQKELVSENKTNEKKKGGSGS